MALLKGGRPIREPEYETADYFAVTAFAETIDEASRKALRYMIDNLDRMGQYTQLATTAPKGFDA